jgi:hypothetical protein
VGDLGGLPWLMVSLPHKVSESVQWRGERMLMLDPICKRYGIRMIVVDRPGIGATPVVPLEKRIEVSCRMFLHLLVRTGSDD